MSATFIGVTSAAALITVIWLFYFLYEFVSIAVFKSDRDLTAIDFMHDFLDDKILAAFIIIGNVMFILSLPYIIDKLF